MSSNPTPHLPLTTNPEHSDIAIRVQNLSKSYQIYDWPQDRLKQSVLPRFQRFLGRTPKTYFREFWALKDVSFEVKKGETVGIIGRNGSGKSTLLQIICGTLNPTSGSVEAHGRIAALLELGSGFNPEFTGRENIYVNAAVLGLSKKEVDECFDDIAAFADIGQFIEQPVKTYSSGMVVRLAFSVNVMIEPEIMIVDEALAVGDMNFQAKCMTALTRIQGRGATILFVSHDIGAVKSLCSRGVFLEGGNVKTIGKAPDVAELYVRAMREEMNAEQCRSVPAGVPIACGSERAIETIQKERNLNFKTSDSFDSRVAQFRYGSGEARIRFAELLDMEDQPIVSLEFNQEVKVRIHFHVHSGVDLSPNYYIMDDKKNLIVGAGPRQLGHRILHCLPGRRYIVTYVATLPLQDGNYSIQIQINKPIIPDETAEFLDVIENAVVFNVQRRKEARVWAKVLLPHKFEVVET